MRIHERGGMQGLEEDAEGCHERKEVKRKVLPAASLLLLQATVVTYLSRAFSTRERQAKQARAVE